jgi:hypothetical protein
MRAGTGSSAPRVDRPIFVIGTGRSGTTLLFGMLAEHPDLAWISNYSNLFARSRLAAAAARLRHLPGVAQLGASRLRPRPVEGYRPWLACHPGFNRPVRDLVGCDADARCVACLRFVAERHLGTRRRARFVAKYTGWPRVGFFDRAFPDALYVHVLRDGRDVAASLLRSSFWDGWEGPARWRFGPLDEQDERIWARSGRSFAVLAGIQWKLLATSIRRAGQAIGPRYLEIRYEDVVVDRDAVLRRLLGWCGLEDSPRFWSRVRAFELRDARAAWRERLPEAEGSRLEQAIAGDLASFGYVD